ncbi:MAG: hypothetical protein N2689_07385 [Verrucomicrobiae bacterium]|nr:hypothetical protein [Verrucomicrobiae bacterium]
MKQIVRGAMRSNDSSTVRRIRSGSLFCIFYFRFASWMIPGFLAIGVAALFGADAIKLNGHWIHGLRGLTYAILAALFTPAFLAVSVFVFTWPGLWLYSKFRKFRIDYINDET